MIFNFLVAVKSGSEHCICRQHCLLVLKRSKANSHTKKKNENENIFLQWKFKWLFMLLKSKQLSKSTLSMISNLCLSGKCVVYVILTFHRKDIYYMYIIDSDIDKVTGYQFVCLFVLVGFLFVCLFVCWCVGVCVCVFPLWLPSSYVH